MRKITKLGLSEHGNLTMQTARHFSCTYDLINGGTLHGPERITGHKSIQTLMIYVHPARSRR